MLKSLYRSLKFISQHPISSRNRIQGFYRYFLWQFVSLLKRDIRFNWILNSKLVVRRGMTGATGNIYCGLHEFHDMGFLLHFLRPDDLFVDVGANIGSYTILASKVIGAKVVAIEPDPSAVLYFKKNVIENTVSDHVTIVEAAGSRIDGTVNFSKGLDTTNHIVDNQAIDSQKVSAVKLDTILRELSPALIKIDVEGHERDVLFGARETLLKSSLSAVIIEGRDPDAVSILKAAGFNEAYYDPFKRAVNELPFYNFIPMNSLFIRGSISFQRVKDAPRVTIYGVSI